MPQPLYLMEKGAKHFSGVQAGSMTGLHGTSPRAYTRRLGEGKSM
jgi:hypothetical protein